MYPQDIKAVPLPKAEGIGGFNDLRNISALQVGTGARSFKADQDGIFLGGNTFATAPFRVNMAGAVVASSLTLTNAVIIDPTITGIQTGSEIAIQGWQHDLVFSITDLDTVAWASGTITLMNGDTYSIDAGNTGNMAAETFVYLDIATSTTVLQTTTTKTTAVGSGKIMVAIAKNGAVEPTFFVFASDNKNLNATDIVSKSILAANIGDNVITANQIFANTITASEIAANTITAAQIAATTITAAQIAANTITANEIAANTVTASEIATGTITANEIATGTITASEITGTSLSAIYADLGTITAGSLSGITIAIGTGNSIFKADSNGIYLGNATFGSAPFRVTPAGAVTASSITLTNAAVSTGSTWTGNAIAAAYIGDLNASKITAGTINASTITISNLNASNISTGTLSTDRLGANSIAAGKLNVSTLSSIVADIGTVTAGILTGMTRVNIGASSANPFHCYGTSFLSSGKLDMAENIDMNEYNIDAADTVWANTFGDRSDRKLKKDILSKANNLPDILKLRPVSFKFKKSKDNKKRLGLIAQEVQEVIPEAVITDSEGLLGISYSQIISTLIGAVQELKLEIDDLKKVKV